MARVVWLAVLLCLLTGGARGITPDGFLHEDDISEATRTLGRSGRPGQPQGIAGQHLLSRRSVQFEPRPDFGNSIIESLQEEFRDERAVRQKRTPTRSVVRRRNFGRGLNSPEPSAATENRRVPKPVAMRGMRRNLLNRKFTPAAPRFDAVEGKEIEPVSLDAGGREEQGTGREEERGQQQHTLPHDNALIQTLASSSSHPTPAAPVPEALTRQETETVLDQPVTLSGRTSPGGRQRAGRGRVRGRGRGGGGSDSAVLPGSATGVDTPRPTSSATTSTHLSPRSFRPSKPARLHTPTQATPASPASRDTSITRSRTRNRQTARSRTQITATQPQSDALEASPPSPQTQTQTTVQTQVNNRLTTRRRGQGTARQTQATDSLVLAAGASQTQRQPVSEQPQRSNRLGTRRRGQSTAVQTQATSPVIQTGRQTATVRTQPSNRQTARQRLQSTARGRGRQTQRQPATATEQTETQPTDQALPISPPATQTLTEQPQTQPADHTLPISPPSTQTQTQTLIEQPQLTGLPLQESPQSPQTSIPAIPEQPQVSTQAQQTDLPLPILSQSPSPQKSPVRRPSTRTRSRTRQQSPDRALPATQSLDKSPSPQTSPSPILSRGHLSPRPLTISPMSDVTLPSLPQPTASPQQFPGLQVISPVTPSLSQPSFHSSSPGVPLFASLPTTSLTQPSSPQQFSGVPMPSVPTVSPQQSPVSQFSGSPTPSFLPTVSPAQSFPSFQQSLGSPISASLPTVSLAQSSPSPQQSFGVPLPLFQAEASTQQSIVPQQSQGTALSSSGPVSSSPVAQTKVSSSRGSPSRSRNTQRSRVSFQPSQSLQSLEPQLGHLSARVRGPAAPQNTVSPSRVRGRQLQQGVKKAEVSGANPQASQRSSLPRRRVVMRRIIKGKKDTGVELNKVPEELKQQERPSVRTFQRQTIRGQRQGQETQQRLTPQKVEPEQHSPVRVQPQPETPVQASQRQLPSETQQQQPQQQTARGLQRQIQTKQTQQLQEVPQLLQESTQTSGRRFGGPLRGGRGRQAVQVAPVTTGGSGGITMGSRGRMLTRGRVFGRPRGTSIEDLTSETYSTEDLTTEAFSTEDHTTEDLTTERYSTEDLTTEDLTTETFSKEDLTLSMEDLTTEVQTMEDLTLETISKEDLTLETMTKEDMTLETMSKEDLTLETMSKEDLTLETMSKEDMTVENMDFTSEVMSVEDLTSEVLSTEDQTTESLSAEDFVRGAFRGHRRFQRPQRLQQQTIQRQPQQQQHQRRLPQRQSARLRTSQQSQQLQSQQPGQVQATRTTGGRRTFGIPLPPSTTATRKATSQQVRSRPATAASGRAGGSSGQRWTGGRQAGQTARTVGRARGSARWSRGQVATRGGVFGRRRQDSPEDMTSEIHSAENLTTEDLTTEVLSSEDVTLEDSTESPLDDLDSLENISQDLTTEDNWTTEDTTERNSLDLSLERVRRFSRKAFSAAGL